MALLHSSSKLNSAQSDSRPAYQDLTKRGPQRSALPCRATSACLALSTAVALAASTASFAVSTAVLTSNSACVAVSNSVTLAAGNTAPRAIDSRHDAFALAPNSNAHFIKLTATDPDQTPLTYVIQTLPTKGTLLDTVSGSTLAAGATPSTGRVRYVPAPDAQGSDSFTWIARDPSGVNSAPATATIDHIDYVLPTGIPQPTFGLTQQAPPRPDPWNAEVANYYYVDRYHAAATDSGNTYGTPAKPRRTIPGNLTAGAVVEIHGNYDPSGTVTMSGSGTANAPIFFRGASAAEQPRIPREIRPVGSYLILENLNIDGGKMAILAPSHHIAVRHCQMHDRQSTGIAIGSWLDTQDQVTDVLIFDNDIHHMGKFNADGSFQQVEFDAHGVLCFTMSERVWILENHIHHVHGDSIQLSRTHSQANQHPARFIYIGRNNMHDNGEGALDFKVPQNVVVSENTMYGFIPTAVSGVGGGSSAAAVVCHDDTGNATWPDPYRIWFFLNEVYDCQFGFRLSAGNELYAYGNIIHDIEQTADSTIGDGSIYRFGCGIRVTGVDNIRLVNNTVVDCHLGIGMQVNGTTRFHMQNNLVAHMKQNSNYHLIVETLGSGSDLALTQCVFTNGLFFQPGSQARIGWPGGTYDVAGLLSGPPGLAGYGNGCIEGDPHFVNCTTADFCPLTNSPAVNAGTDPGLNTLFSPLYGTTVETDVNMTERPKGDEWEIGAYEVDENGGDPPPTSKPIIDDFSSCASGPAIAQTDPACLLFDYDLDGDVDQVDFAEWQRQAF